LISKKLKTILCKYDENGSYFNNKKLDETGIMLQE